MDGVTGVAPGRNIQLIPCGTFSGARVFDESSALRASQTDGRAGIDAKVVLRDSLTVDATVNPDFSRFESDEAGEVLTLSSTTDDRSDFGLRTSDFGLRTSHLAPRTSHSITAACRDTPRCSAPPDR